jgi:hypothetical protein
MALPTISITANVVAFYAAIMSTVIAGVQLSNYLRDRARLKVRIALRRIATAPDGRRVSMSLGFPAPSNSKIFLVINALNLGRRPLKITHWGGKFVKTHVGKNAFTVYPEQLPKILSEGESVDEMTDEMLDSIDDIKSAYVLDASDKAWKVPRSNLRKLKKDFRSLQSKDASSRPATA